jgi:hypothetical protein
MNGYLWGRGTDGISYGALLSYLNVIKAIKS